MKSNVIWTPLVIVINIFIVLIIVLVFKNANKVVSDEISVLRDHDNNIYPVKSISNCNSSSLSNVNVDTARYSIPITLKLSGNIPKTIHVTSRTAPNATNKNVCTKLNPDHKFIVYNNSQVFNNLDNQFGSKLISKMRLIEKIDLWRYIILRQHGGIYLDNDAECKQPISKWLNLYFNESSLLKDLPIHPQQLEFFKNHLRKSNNVTTLEIDMIVSVETERNQPYFGILQWALVSTANNPILTYIIDFVLEQLYVRMPFKNVSKIRDSDVLDRTGPAAFSSSILKYIATHSRDLGGLVHGISYLYPRILFPECQIDFNGQLLYLFDNEQNITMLILPYRAFKHSEGYVYDAQNLIFHLFESSWWTDFKK